MRIKVLFFVSTLESGGPTNVIFNIIKYLDRAIIEPVIVTLSPEPEQTRIQDFKNLDVSIYQFNQNRFSWMVSNGKALTKFIEKIQPHIIHSHSLRPDIFSAKRLHTYIRISTIHSNLRDNYRNTYNKIVGDYFAHTQIKHISQLEKSVACALSVYNLYKGEIRAMEFIPNGVDTELFKPLSKDIILERRRTLGLPLNKILFITIGSLCSRKDPHTVIKGFLNSNYANSGLLIVLGTGQLEKVLRNTYSSKNILFKGFVKDVIKYLEVANFFISASLSEGLPNTVIEALSCGIPVCLSDIPAHREILAINPNAGTTFNSKKEKELSNAIHRLTNIDYGILQNAALGVIDQELSAKKMSTLYQKNYLSLYNEKFK